MGAFAPDLILADYNLPNGMDGLVVAAKIRETLHRQIPVIILTGDISTDTLRRIAGQDCVQLNKPVKATDVMQAIQRLLPIPQCDRIRPRRAGAKPSGAPEAPSFSWSMTIAMCARASAACSRPTDGPSKTLTRVKPSSRPIVRAAKDVCWSMRYLPGMTGLRIAAAITDARYWPAGHHDHRKQRRADGGRSHESRRVGLHREACWP